MPRMPINVIVLHFVCLKSSTMDNDEGTHLKSVEAVRPEEIKEDTDKLDRYEDKFRGRRSRHRNDSYSDDYDRKCKRPRGQDEIKDRERGINNDREWKDRRYERDRYRDKVNQRSHRSSSREYTERYRDKLAFERSQDRGKAHETEYGSRERERDLTDHDHDLQSSIFCGSKEDKDYLAERVAKSERCHCTVFASQISLGADERDVYEFFSKVGKVRDVHLIMDQNSRRSEGFGYVEFYEAKSVPLAISLSGGLLLGQPVKVKPLEAEKNVIQSITSVASAASGSVGNSEVARRLYVGNIHFDIKEDQLRSVFEPFGTVELVQLPTDSTGSVKGYGFVQFARLEDAKAAQSLDGQVEFAGKVMKVAAYLDPSGVHEADFNISDSHESKDGISELNNTAATISLADSLGAQLLRGTGIPFPSVFLSVDLSIPPVTVPPLYTVGDPSECVLLKNMFDTRAETVPDFDEDIKQDVEDKCSRYGYIRHIYVDKNESSSGCVYLRYESIQSAIAAQRGLHGKWSAEKIITARFMDLEEYEGRFPESKRV